ncbi:MAG TPA: response regulator transcription factor [Gemmatimonadaceae bacterium]|nr:response regulator transcription factor [Gemmatimonadaceae bacterium]
MASETALIIDDEPRIRRVVANALADDFGRVLEAGTGKQGVRMANDEHPSLIVLDLGLPDTPGILVATQIRKLSDAIILVLSARHADNEKAQLLDAGADDYVTKPFSTLEFKARVRALLRRANAQRPAGARSISSGALTIDLARHVLEKNGKQVHLTPIEWELVRVLMVNAGRTLTHRQLFNAVWVGRQFGDAQQYLRVHIANIRRKIETNPLDPQYIITEPGVGYRFAAPPPGE